VRPVFVLIFHAPLPHDAGPLARVLDAARAALAEVHRARFLAAGAADVRIIAEAGDRPFGARLRAASADLPPGGGAVILGSGSLPLATAADREELVEAAGADATSDPTTSDVGGGALANNRYSGDVVALPDAAAVLAALPDLPGDNALPRWLAEHRGLRVTDLRRRAHLQADLDGPADLLLLARSRLLPPGVRAIAAAGGWWSGPAGDRIAAVAAVAGDPRAEIVVSGRISAAGIALLERATACRVRALLEERGLRAASPLAQGPSPAAVGAARARPAPGSTSRTGTPAAVPRRAVSGSALARVARATRPPVSVLGIALDAAGPAGLGALLARLGDAAIVDSRVLVAHVVGADERRWPSLEDRLASDLLLPDRVSDPWLRALTESAVAAPIPILLGGHSLVGPGLWLLFPPPRGSGAGGRAGSWGGPAGRGADGGGDRGVARSTSTPGGGAS
jgi:hypothetical protein